MVWCRDGDRQASVLKSLLQSRHLNSALTNRCLAAFGLIMKVFKLCCRSGYRVLNHLININKTLTCGTCCMCNSNTPDLLLLLPIRFKLTPNMPCRETVLDEWAVKGNAMADMFAEEARQHLTPAFWQTWKAVQQHQSNTWSFGKALHKLLVQIGIRAQASTIVTGVPGPQVQEQSEVLNIDPGILALSLRQVGDFPKHLQVEETPHILRWLQSLVDPQQSISWVSYHQLLVDYQFFSQRQGPFTNGRRWTDRRVDHVYNYPQQVQWFGRYIQNMAKANKEPLHTDQRRPSSSTLAFWCGCLRVAIPNQRLSSIDDFYKKGAKHLPIRQIVRDMADLPVAS